MNRRQLFQRFGAIVAGTAVAPTQAQAELSAELSGAREKFTIAANQLQAVTAQMRQATDTFMLNIKRIDPEVLQRMVHKPGGIADLVIQSVSQGQRGRDERLRRALDNS
jgi:hypothetical protein